MQDLTKKYPAISEALREALATTATERFDHYGIWTEGERVSEISAESYDGFIAHTNGGFRLIVPCTLRDVECEGLSDFEESTLRQYIDQSYRDAAECFIEARPDIKALWDTAQADGTDCDGDVCDWLMAYFDGRENAYFARYHNADAPQLPGVPFAPRHCAEVEELREALWEYTDEWLTEGATFFYEVRVIFYAAGHRRNVTGADEVYVMSGINTDFEYGRDSGLECVKESDYKIARLNPARVRTIVEAFAEAV